MKLVELEIHLPDDLQAFVRSQVRSGRYAYEDEVIAHALYLLVQKLEDEGSAPPEAKAVLEQPIEPYLAELRHAIAAKRWSNPPDILDITQVVDRWDEIMARTEAGEPFVIAIDGVPKARLEPILAGDREP